MAGAETSGKGFIGALRGISHPISTVPAADQALKPGKTLRLKISHIYFNCASGGPGIETRFSATTTTMSAYFNCASGGPGIETEILTSHTTTDSISTVPAADQALKRHELLLLLHHYNHFNCASGGPGIETSSDASPLTCFCGISTVPAADQALKHGP